MKQIMKLGRILGFATAFLFGFVATAFAAEPLVDVAWLKANLGKPGIAVVDMQPTTDFLRGHIPGAGNTDFGKSGWREERAADKVPGMFPDKLDKLTAHVGSLGIDNNSHVVLVAPGASTNDMGWATRIYWTFKVLGHDNVSILDGGMDAWIKDKGAVETGAAKVTAKTFTPHPRMEMIATVNDVKAAKAKGVLLVDNRPEDQYLGINGSPMAKENGTLPGARNMPLWWTTENGGGKFRSKAQLEKLYKVANVPTNGEQINFCNTGHWASVGWFVSSELMGNKKARIYDGSMTEWTITKAGPVEHKVVLD